MITTAAPFSAISASARWIAAAAPASTPQVGWLTTNVEGVCMISRPTRNFCRLPPDSDARLRLRAGGAHVEALDDLAGEFVHLAAPDEAEARQRPARDRR